MSNSSDRGIPREISNQIGGLRKNDAFSNQVWSLLEFYRENLIVEARTIPLEERKKLYDEAIGTLDSHIQAANAIPDGYGFGYSSHFIEQLENMRRHWISHIENLDRVDGRSTHMETPRWLVRNLAEVFDTWGVPKRKLVGFLERTLPVLSPDGSVPSKSSLYSMLSECSK